MNKRRCVVRSRGKREAGREGLTRGGGGDVGGDGARCGRGEGLINWRREGTAGGTLWKIGRKWICVSILKRLWMRERKMKSS